MEILSYSIRIAEFLQRLNVISVAVIIILFLMSVLTWYLILTKLLQLGLAHWRSNQFLKLLGQAESLEVIITHLSRKSLTGPCSHLAVQGLNAAKHYTTFAPQRAGTICTQSEFITRHLRRAIDEETRQLESGLTILASIGSTAPFIGLLGTVLGIYDALLTISARSSAALDTVAAPIGEALIMTAVGLAVAIPAVLGYNLLVRGNRRLLGKLDSFAHDLHTYLNTGAHLQSSHCSCDAQEKR